MTSNTETVAAIPGEIVDTPSDNPNTSTEHADSLAATAAEGEAALQPEGGEAQLEIPDKFRKEDGSLDEAALLKSYQELERSRQEPEPKPEETEPESGDKTPGADLEADLAGLAEEIGKDGKLSDASRQRIADKYNVTPEYVDRIVAGERAIAQLNAMELYELAGGRDDFNKMVAWAAKHLGNDAAETFVSEVSEAQQAGNKAKLTVAMNGMLAQYKTAIGKAWAPELTGTDPAGETIKPFANEAEFQKAIASEEYQQGDEAYHRTVNLRLKKSMAMGIF